MLGINWHFLQRNRERRASMQLKLIENTKQRLICIFNVALALVETYSIGKWLTYVLVISAQDGNRSVEYSSSCLFA